MFNALRIMFPKAKVIKTHPPMPDEFDAVLTSHRDLRRIAASLWRKWGNLPDYGWPEVWKGLDEVVQWHPWWCKHEKLVMDMKYEDMVASPKAMIKKLDDSLSGNNDPQEVLAELEKIRLPAQGYDPTTLMHWNHITSNDPMCLAPLTEQESLEIQNRFSVWQEEHGYH